MKRLNTLFLAASTLLSGCAALQIDVDVYKGPLVHDEDTQVQQLASIAMSGKVVMLVQRNKWLDTVDEAWRKTASELSRNNPSKSMLSRHIRADEWKSLGICTAAETKCRNARLINDMLSAYEDRVEPALEEELNQTRLRYQSYTSARKGYVTAGQQIKLHELAAANAVLHRKDDKQAEAERAKAAAVKEEAQALITTTENLRQTWAQLVALLQATKLLALRQPDRGHEIVERQVADILAQLTDPNRLLCANQTLRLSGELGLGLELMERSIAAVPEKSSDVAAVLAADRRAVAQLNAALRLAPNTELPRLMQAASLPTSSAGCELTGNRNFKPNQPSALSAASRTGVQREAAGRRGDQTHSDLQDIDALWGDLLRMNASGFDRGRPQPGLDRLADEAAGDRSKRRAADVSNSSAAVGGSAALADGATTQQLQDSVVDLASRMQFLAVNLRLVDDDAAAAAASGDSLEVPGLTTLAQSDVTSPAKKDALAFKATLETIANSLLVLAEDQRRQRSHRSQQLGMAGIEYQSAVAAFQVDPARRFDQLLQHLRDRKAAALNLENSLRSGREAAVKAASKRVEVAKGAVDEQMARAQAELPLALTFDGRLPDDMTLASEREEPPERWVDDAKRLKAELLRGPAKIGLLDLRVRIESWLSKEAESAGNKPLARHRRLKEARGQLAYFQTANEPLPRAEAISRMAADISERVTAAKRPLQSLRAELAARETALREAQDAAKPPKESLPPSALLGSALDAVQAARSAVLAQAAAARGVHDVETVVSLLRAQLQNMAADQLAVKQQALGQLEQWATSVKSPIRVPEAESHSALQTLDRVEAFLSYSRVDAINRGSPGGAQQASDALDALMARRERMAYLRPASTYLRSALATTGQQSDPGLEWQNLLYAKFRRLIPERDPSIQRERAVRADLDKSFWQNVNKVSVSAGGSSNFAIAKDDVGNWYVKAMGADPEAMIKAAKGLALFNLGGRVDSNFLRMDELRGMKDRSPSQETELQSLQEGRNGAAAGAYGSTLKVFATNHSQAVQGLLTELDTQLKANNLGQRLGQRWDSRYDPSAGKRAQLPNLDMTTAGELAALHSQALSATADGLLATAISPPGSTASDFLLKSLGLLVQQRNRLGGMVAELAGLTGTELANAQSKKAALEIATQALADAQTEREKPAGELKALQEQVGSASKEEKDRLSPSLAAKQAQVNAAGDLIAIRHQVWKTAVDASVVAASALAAAQDRQKQALADVDEVWLKNIKALAARQLRAVEELETAARVVSQGVQGKTSKP